MVTPEYKLIYAPREILGFTQERVNAVTSDAIILTASIHVFVKHSRIDREKATKFVNRAKKNGLKVFKADGYQIYIEAKWWNKEILSDDNVLDILEHIAPFFKKNWKPLVYTLSAFKDMSDEEYISAYGERDEKEKKETRRSILIGGLVLTVILALVISGYFIGFFGLVLLVAYADDMFARR